VSERKSFNSGRAKEAIGDQRGALDSSILSKESRLGELDYVNLIVLLLVA